MIKRISRENMIMKSLQRTIIRSVPAIFILAFCLSSYPAFSTPPPRDYVSYRGDVNGDFIVSLLDLVATRRLSSLIMVNCSHVVPSNGTKCDTVDLTGDGAVTLADIVAVRNLTSLVSYAPADLPWTLDTSSIPASIVNSSPIQAAVANSMGKGRPGIVVRFSVASGPAILSGREYNPAYDGIRDHASHPWATQVLAITQTDFPSDQSGATELTIPNVGTPVELTCINDGTVTLNIDVMADILKGIPAISESLTVDCSIFPANTLPVADAGSPQSVNTWDTVTLDGSASYDPDGSPISYSWTQVGGPRDVTLSDATVVMPTFDVTFEGTYTFELMVNDGQQYSFPVTTTVEATDQDFDDDGILDIWDPDDDNDGVNDWTEIGWGYNPFDPNSYPPACVDGQDNDGDTITDYPDDPGCSNPLNTSEFDAISITAGFMNTCAITNTGGIKCWGENESGQLGNGDGGSGKYSSIPVDVVGLSDFVTMVSANGMEEFDDGIFLTFPKQNHTCALTELGDLKCWGANYHGQLGDGTTIDRFTPVNVTGLLNNVVEVGTGAGHTCVLTDTGEIKCWGNDFFGQVWNGTLSSNPVGISVGGSHSCLLTEAGGAKCWGNDLMGTCGGNWGCGGTGCEIMAPWNVPCCNTPEDVVGLTSGVAAITAGGFHACALTDSGDVKCWGSNFKGQLGDNQACQQNCSSCFAAGMFTVCLGGSPCCKTPTDVVGLTGGVVSITAGGDHTCALMNTGGVKCWGSNEFCQLGDNKACNDMCTITEGYGTSYTASCCKSPVDVPDLTSGVVSISAGGYHTCAVMDTGSVKCWGKNSDGQLGDGTRMERSTPVDVVW